MNTILAQSRPCSLAGKDEIQSLLERLDWKMIGAMGALARSERALPPNWEAISRTDVLSQAWILYRLTLKIVDLSPHRSAKLRKEQGRTLRDLWTAIALSLIFRFSVRPCAEAFEDLFARWEEVFAQWDVAKLAEAA